MKKTMHRKNGFTLIELLVVIAIIALLLSVIMPALNLAKEKANNLSCRANVRSLSLGFRLYTEANDGEVFGYGISGVHNLWLVQIEDQLSEIDKVRYCPSTKLNPKPPPHTWPDGLGTAKLTWIWPYDVIESEHGSYGFNGWLYSRSAGIVSAAEWERSAWKSANVAANSASIPIFIDEMWVDLWPRDSDTVLADHDLEMGGGNMMCRCMIDRHGGKLSVSFLDGHVEPIALKQMWSLKWSKQFATDAEDHLRIDDTPIYK